MPDGLPGEHEVPLDGPLTNPERVRRWIEEYARVTERQSGVAPPGMPSAFVLQHHLDPFAQVVATAAVRGEWVLDPDPGRWWITLEPTYLYPLRVRVAKGAARHLPSVAERLDAAAAGYREAGRRIATAFPAAEKMSSRQRLGMVDDMWEIALHRLVGGPPPQRQSCCLMYSLPGLHPCTGCPREAEARPG